MDLYLLQFAAEQIRSEMRQKAYIKMNMFKKKLGFEMGRVLIQKGLFLRIVCSYVRSFVRSFVLPSVTWNLRQSFALKFLKWCISQQLLIRKHSYLDHCYPEGLAFTP